MTNKDKSELRALVKRYIDGKYEKEEIVKNVRYFGYSRRIILKYIDALS